MSGKLALPGLLALVLLAGCTVRPAAELIDPKTGQYKLAEAPDLKSTATPGAQIWRAPDIANYPVSAYYIPEAQYFPGPSVTFGNLTDAEKAQVAQTLTEDVRSAIGRRFRLADGPGPGVHRLDLIIGRIIPPSEIQGPPVPGWSGALALRDNMQSSTGGLLLIGGKFYDTSTNKQLAAFLAPVQVPAYADNPQPISRQGTLQFAIDASQRFATDLAASLVRQKQINNTSGQTRGGGRQP